MSFSDVQDQPAPIRLLRNMLKRQRVPNGLLFWGPGGVGKRLLALELAKAINCSEREDDACDACLQCRKVIHGNHPDVKVVAPASKSRLIRKEEDIEPVAEMASYRPYEGGWRVFVIDDAERMTLPAQNFFLKTLEEPPSNTLFILLSEWPRMLLDTIRSRCQPVQFGALRPKTVAALLQREKGLDAQKADALAALSQGQMSRAFDLADTRKRDVVLEMTARLAGGEDPLALSEAFCSHLDEQVQALTQRLQAAMREADQPEMTREDQKELAEQQEALLKNLTRRETMEYLYLFQTWYRDEMVYTETGDAARVLNRDQLDRLQNAAPADFGARMQAIEKAWLYIERNLKQSRVLRDLFCALAP